MAIVNTISRFNILYIGDSLLERLELNTQEAACHLRFSMARVLEAEGASIFEPRARYEPAWLRLSGVRSIRFDRGYQLNSTVVDFGAIDHGDGEYIEFYFELTGGVDPAAFLVKMTILKAGAAATAGPQPPSAAGVGVALIECCRGWRSWRRWRQAHAEL
jgi:hypothetical protein